MSDFPPPSQNLQLKYDIKYDKYQSFIMEVREKVKDNDKTSHRCPILPLKEEIHPSYVDLILQEDGMDKGLVRIRRYDLRLITYQNPCGISIDVDEFQIYDDESKIVKFGIEGLKLGLSTFLEAVNHLENVSKNPDFYEHKNDMGTSFLMICDRKKIGDTQENSKIRTFLAVLCLVLCEAIKIDLFSCVLVNAFEFGYEVSITSWLLDRINDWSFFSEQLLADTVHYTDTIDECNTCLPINLNDWHEDRRVIGITCRDITKFLGICKAFSFPPEPIEEISILDGKCLVEIFSVSVYFSDGQSGDVYGSIKVKTDYGTYSIYERDYNESEFIESHDILSIQDSNGFISPLCVVEFDIDLKDRGGNLEINKGKIIWEDTLEYDYYDSRLAAMVKGKCGYAIVYYSLFKPAVQVVVEATLLIKEGHSCTDENVCVCGRLYVRSGAAIFDTENYLKYYQIMLYDKPVRMELSTCTCEQVQSGKDFKLKLSRTRVNVRVNESLIFLAELKSCEGKRIVTGSIELFPKDFGHFEETMQGHFDDSHLLHLEVKRIF